MERLTARNENGKREAFYPYCFREDTCDGDGGGEKCETCEFMLKVCETLAKYEDTGLTPPEIMELKERNVAKHPVQTTEGVVCPVCGSMAYPWSRFCDECGQRWWED